MLGLSLASLALNVASTGASIAEGRKQTRAQEEIQDIESAQMEVEQEAARRASYNAMRKQQAAVSQAASNRGVGGSSGALGAISASTTNLLSSFSSQAGKASTARGITAQYQKAADASSRANLYGGVAQVGMGVAQAGFSNYQNQKALTGEMRSIPLMLSPGKKGIDFI